ncbi:MAG: hypothetical protein ACRDI0_01545 [Actinomycetota bacterium]
MAHAPRPFLVPPKTPLFRRRGVQMVLIALVWGIFALVGWGLRVSQDADRHRADVESFATRVESALAASGVASSLQGGPLILPEMANVAAALREGERPGGLAEQVEAWSTGTEDAASAIGAVETDRAELQRARQQMVHGLRLYAVLAREVGVARLLDGPSQRQLLSAMDEQFFLAAELFDGGWGALQAERRKAGTLPPVDPGGGLPPGFELPPGTELPQP